MNFRDMSPEQRKAISVKGGQAAHAKGTAHQWTPEEARDAGRKGGKSPRRRRRSLVEVTQG